tara:strand:- start:3336 stop:3515 length:180 start_codon:yes stop_codon:yes gene_type:complete
MSTDSINCSADTIGQQVICGKCGLNWDLQDKKRICGETILRREEVHNLAKEYLKRIENS